FPEAQRAVDEVQSPQHLHGPPMADHGQHLTQRAFVGKENRFGQFAKTPVDRSSLGCCHSASVSMRKLRIKSVPTSQNIPARYNDDNPYVFRPHRLGHLAGGPMLPKGHLSPDHAAMRCMADHQTGPRLWGGGNVMLPLEANTEAACDTEWQQ